MFDVTPLQKNTQELKIGVDAPLTKPAREMMQAWLQALGYDMHNVQFTHHNPQIGFGVPAAITLPGWSAVLQNTKLKATIWQATRHLKRVLPPA